MVPPPLLPGPAPPHLVEQHQQQGPVPSPLDAVPARQGAAAAKATSMGPSPTPSALGTKHAAAADTAPRKQVDGFVPSGAVAADQQAAGTPQKQGAAVRRPTEKAGTRAPSSSTSKAERGATATHVPAADVAAVDRKRSSSSRGGSGRSSKSKDAERTKKKRPRSRSRSRSPVRENSSGDKRRAAEEQQKQRQRGECSPGHVATAQGHHKSSRKRSSSRSPSRDHPSKKRPRSRSREGGRASVAAGHAATGASPKCPQLWFSAAHYDPIWLCLAPQVEEGGREGGGLVVHGLKRVIAGCASERVWVPR
eukprot:1147923-Pelagomonas_calceolata.AAC.5